jgi:uncharacterized protein
MDQSVSRRSLLGGAAAGVGLSVAGSLEAFARPHPGRPLTDAGYGPLVPDPANLLALPAGFSYRVVAQSGVTPTRTGLFPGDPDGMGVFPNPGGGSALICNHEISSAERPAVPTDPGLTYDANSTGGTSTITVDQSGNRVEIYTSLAGTDNNCAGGITPWGTWLTCEETERRAGTLVTRAVAQPGPPPVPAVTVRLLKDHGYVFEVDPASQDANQGKASVALTFLGRFSHEAVAVDPDTNDIYLTEDAVNPNGLYYRWQPPQGFVGRIGALRELAESEGPTAGRLQAMSCYRGRRHIVDLSEATEVGTRYRVRWFDVPDRIAGPVGAPVPRTQAYAGPITRSRKLEGQWWANGGAYFVASYARPLETGDGSLNAHDGQVWFFDPRRQTITLKTLFGFRPPVTPEPEGVWNGPDNITVSPHGGMIVAEDGAGKQHLIGVTERGRLYALARNDQPANGEFCGPAFSADGNVLFVNTQAATYGATYAITGPWRRR